MVSISLLMAFREQDYKEVYARTLSVKKEFKVNKYITIRLEEIEHYHEVDMDTLDYFFHKGLKIPADELKIPDDEVLGHLLGELYDYLFIIRIYVIGIDKEPKNTYRLLKYDEFITKLGFLPCRQTDPFGGVEWDNSINSGINNKFNEMCQKLQNWVNKSYQSNIIDNDLALSLLDKLVSAGDPIAKNAIKRLN